MGSRWDRQGRNSFLRMGGRLGTSLYDWWCDSRVLSSPAYLAAQCFPGCFRGVSLVHSSCELLLPPLYADLLRRLRLSLPLRGEGFAVLPQPPKAHDQALGCWLRELVWLPAH